MSIDLDVESITNTNEQLVASIRAGDKEAENMLKLWKRNRGFIGKIALRFTGYAELEDLKQEGYIALYEAVRHYDEGKGVPFINYAAFWIKQGMQRYIENYGGVVRIPSGAQQIIKKYKKIVSEYWKYYGKGPTDREIRACLGVSAGKLEDIKESARMGCIQSLNEPLGEEEDYTIVDVVASGEEMEEDAIKRLDKEAMSRQLWKVVDELEEGQQSVIRCRYREELTLKEAGAVLGVDMNKIRDMQNKALAYLRRPEQCQKFRGYYEEYLQAHSFHHVGVESFQRTWTSEVEREALKL